VRIGEKLAEHFYFGFIQPFNSILKRIRLRVVDGASIIWDDWIAQARSSSGIYKVMLRAADTTKEKHSIWEYIAL
jgi:hypothetical protein